MAIKLIEKWSYDYIKMDCTNDKCYGVLAVHRVCFALSLFHAILSTSLIGVRDTQDKRAAIQNGYVLVFTLCPNSSQGGLDGGVLRSSCGSC